MLSSENSGQANNGLQRWKLTLEYDGSGFKGWQKQRNGFGVQECLEIALQRLCQTRIKTWAAGRTDTGVHAQGQVVHCDISRIIAPLKLCSALNAHMRHFPVRVIAARKVLSDFNARFQATMRYYTYRVFLSKIESPLRKHYTWRVPQQLDDVLLHRISVALVGHRDFSPFRAAGCQALHCHRTLCVVDWASHGDERILHVAAPSFLYRQVRILCGSMIDVARHKCEINQVLKALHDPTHQLGTITAPAHGLKFLGADYPADPCPFVPDNIKKAAYEGLQRYKPAPVETGMMS